MKKFTTLKEDLIKEELKAYEQFDLRFKEVNDKMRILQNALDDYKKEYYGDSSGKRKLNWGYSGSLGYVSEQLDTILEHLGVQDMIDDSNKYNV